MTGDIRGTCQHCFHKTTLIYTRNKSFKCTICGKTFKAYYCRYCQGIFYHRSFVYLYECSFCHQRFISPKKPKQCPHINCLKSFKYMNPIRIDKLHGKCKLHSYHVYRPPSGVSVIQDGYVHSVDEVLGAERKENTEKSKIDWRGARHDDYYD